MLSSLETAKRRGRDDRQRSTRCARRGSSRFDNPQKLRGHASGAAPSSPTCTCRSAINGDLALFQAVNRLLLERDAVDHEFVATVTASGFDALRAHLLRGSTRIDVDRDHRPAARRRSTALADLIAGSERTIVCWAMGLTQHRNAVATIQEIVNTLLLRGMIGKPGAGLCPVRGHSNVQGDRTMGIWERPTDAFLDRHADGARVRAAARARARRGRGDPRRCATGASRCFIAMGGNFLSAAPDTRGDGRGAAALRG